MNITKTEDIAGTFGSVGAYQRGAGTFTGEVDSTDAKNTIVQDLALASKNANGMVDYTADFVLAMPKDISNANGVIRYDAAIAAAAANPILP